MNDAWHDLYAAIFKRAVIDDNRRITKMINDDMENLGFEYSETYEILRKYKNEIDNEIRESIFEEAKNWPNNTNNKKHLIKIRDKYIEIIKKEIAN